jgi:general secretion pathway protein D
LSSRTWNAQKPGALAELSWKTACEESMTRRFRPAAMVLLVVVLTLPALADQAKSLFKKGEDAEARQNYEQAYDYYKQAYDLKPKDLSYRAAFERLRFLAGASHVHRGQLLREAGKLQEALAEFQKASEIDPSSEIARQELRITKELIERAKSPAPRSTERPPGELQKRIEEAEGPVELAPIANVPINLKITEDSKVIYETVGKLAGVNVLFDPDYTSRRIKVELNNVTLNQALQIIALESKTFWRVVTPNTIFIAQDNPSKRKEIEQSVIKTFYLSNLSQPTEIQDVVNTLRQIVEISRIQALPSEGAIVVRGTPDQIALADKLVGDLDKAKPEVVVDVAILQVSRDKVHTLGISPPTSATIALQNNLSTTSTGTTTTTSTTSTSTSGTPNEVNLNRLGNLNATDFTATITPATATALFTDSSTKLLQNPEIRSVDGQKASLKIGERLPVATGSFQPGIGGVGINPLVNTQFQYLDVGVNIDVTPTVHSDGEITLKLAMDISSQTGTSNIGGISQPIIGQRKIEHTIRLRDGEVSLLGGMLENEQTRSLSGIPGLSQIPILRYLFGQTNTENSQNEIVFVLIPHIVRELEVSDMNERAIAVGTANAIQLQEDGAPVPQAAAATGQPAATPATPVPAPTQPQVPASTPPASTPPSSPPAEAAPQTTAPTASFSLDPASVTARPGSTFAVNVFLSGAQNVYAVPLQISYDPKMLQMVNISNGGFLSQDGQAVALVHRDDDTTGTLQINTSRPPGAGGVTGQGTVVTLTFQAKVAGQSTLTIAKGGARDPQMQLMPVAGAVATVTVQ